MSILLSEQRADKTQEASQRVETDVKTERNQELYTHGYNINTC